MALNTPHAPRDQQGRFISRDCPDPLCGAGKLQYEGEGFWRCDGLVDPDDSAKELEACAFHHFDGEEKLAA